MKNKGFTLIELLAVIVILAIIALIATPIILNIISDAREESDERSVELYASAVKNAVASYQLTHANAPTSLSQLEIEYDGNVVCDFSKSALYEDETIYLEGCKVNGGDKEYTYGVKKGTCHAVSGDGTQGGDEIACGDEHFYVVTNDGTNIEMITKYALNVGEYPYPGETLGIQSEKTLECRGEINDYGCTLSDYLTYANYGMTYFSDDLYYGELEPLVEVVIFDSKYSENPYANNAYVYDENSNVYEYVENYETYLKTELGVTSASGALANLTQRSTLESLDLPAFPLYMTGVAEGSQTYILTNVFETGMGTTVERVHYSSGPSGQAHVRPIITMLVSELK